MVNAKNIGIIATVVCILVIVLFFIVVIAIIITLANKSVSIADKKCEEYVKAACDNPLPTKTNASGSIIGGQDALAGEFPHMAYLEMNLTNKHEIRRCGGSLISDEFVLTASYCVSEAEAGHVKVKLGSVYVNDTSGQWFAVQKIYRNPSYRSGLGYFDTALVKLNEKVKFSAYIRPICLDSKSDKLYSNIQALGYGDGERGRLQKVDLNVNDEKVEEKCCEKFGTVFMADEHVLCVGHPTEKKSATFGDSGGPLHIAYDNRCANTYKLVGVISAIDRNLTQTDGILLVLVSKLGSWFEENFIWISKIVWPDG